MRTRTKLLKFLFKWQQKYFNLKFPQLWQSKDFRVCSQAVLPKGVIKGGQHGSFSQTENKRFSHLIFWCSSYHVAVCSRVHFSNQLGSILLFDAIKTWQISLIWQLSSAHDWPGGHTNRNSILSPLPDHYCAVTQMAALLSRRSLVSCLYNERKRWHIVCAYLYVNVLVLQMYDSWHRIQIWQLFNPIRTADLAHMDLLHASSQKRSLPRLDIWSSTLTLEIMLNYHSCLQIRLFL